MFQGQVVTEPDAVLELVVPATSMLDSFTWRFDDAMPKTVDLSKGQLGAPPQQGLRFHALGGVEASGKLKAVSFSSLPDGLHTLALNTRTVDGVESQRLIHFDLEASASIQVSWQRDIRPLSEARCNKCHGTGTQPELNTFEQWKANAAPAAAAVRDRRMPADGPLDAANILLVQRWVTGGTLP